MLQEAEIKPWPSVREHWFKVPNIFIERSQDYTRAEMQLILFILRNTVGYRDVCKSITLDEFQHGRKRANGTRIEGGTGLSKSHISRALTSLIARGHVICTIDNGDRGRAKHSYQLPFDDDYLDADDGDDSPPKDGYQNYNPGLPKKHNPPKDGYQNYNPGLPKLQPDQREKPKKETKKDVATPPGPADPTELTTPRNGSNSNSNSKRRQDKPAHPFDERALAHFRLTLDLAKVKYNPKHKSKWLNELRLLREHDHAEMDDIKLVLKWYREYYPPRRGTDGTFTAHCIPTLRKKFFRFLAAAQDAKQNPKTIVNGIQLLTAKDAEKIHETESDIGYCHYLVIHPDWYVDDFYADPSAHYQLMADIINESIRNDLDDALGWRRHLRKFGVGYLVKKHEG